ARNSGSDYGRGSVGLRFRSTGEGARPPSTTAAALGGADRRLRGGGPRPHPRGVVPHPRFRPLVPLAFLGLLRPVPRPPVRALRRDRTPFRLPRRIPVGEGCGDVLADARELVEGLRPGGGAWPGSVHRRGRRPPLVAGHLTLVVGRGMAPRNRGVFAPRVPRPRRRRAPLLPISTAERSGSADPVRGARGEGTCAGRRSVRTRSVGQDAPIECGGDGVRSHPEGPRDGHPPPG